MPLPGNPAHGATVARTLSPVLQLPAGSLYIIQPHNGNAPLVEVEPRFANNRQWLGSDYMLSALGLHGDRPHKRLGDGYYEQRLINEQVAQLTGRRWLGDYRSDEEQYKALMNAGISFAQAHGLRPGVALTPEQMAQLTGDIVWLVEKEITLADGSTSKVLAPQLYARIPKGSPTADLDKAAALLSADNIILSLEQNHLNNQGGSLSAREAILVDARAIGNEAGGRIQAEGILLQAADNIVLRGGQAHAANALILQAGGDIELLDSTASSAGGDAANGYANTVIDQTAGLHVSGSTSDKEQKRGLLWLHAGGNISLRGGHISNRAWGGLTHLQAAGDIEADSIWTQSSRRITWDSKNYLHESQSQESGSRIAAAGDIQLQASRNMRLRASDIDATGHLNLQAQEDIRIEAGQSRRHTQQAFHRSNSGLFGNSSNTYAGSRIAQETIASTVGGQTVTAQAGRNLSISASQVISDQGTVLQAREDIHILAGPNSYASEHFEHSKTSGLFSGSGAGFTIGHRQQSLDAQNAGATSSPSTIASIGGDVIAIVGGNYRQVGGSLITPAGDIAIEAANIAIEEGRNSHSVAEIEVRNPKFEAEENP